VKMSWPLYEFALTPMPTSSTSFGSILALPKEHHYRIVSNWPVAAERRSKIRFSLVLDVRFRSLSTKSVFYGAGRAVNVSSGGALVVSQHLLAQYKISVGALAEIGIEWPSLLDGTIPLQLRTVGRVLRCGASDFAVEFERYEFRTMRHSSEPLAPLARDDIDCPR